MHTKKLILIDGHALVHRAFHALPPSLTSPTGVPTNAVYGFFSILFKVIRDIKPEYIAATFDLAAPTFRHQEFAEYKAHRTKAPDELHAQVPVVKDILKHMGIPIYECPGFEADDMIGTLSEKSKKHKDLQTIIMTGDLDTLQLTEDDHVVVLTFKRGVSDTIVYNEKDVKTRYGLRPDQLPDFKGLKGDPSDNIPGVAGIGDKTASILMNEFGSIEKLYEEIEKGTAEKKVAPGTLKKLKDQKDIALFSKKLATIIRTVPCDFKLADSDWHANLDQAGLEKNLRELNLYSLLKRVPELSGGAPAPVPTQTAFSIPSSPSVTHSSLAKLHLTGECVVEMMQEPITLLACSDGVTVESSAWPEKIPSDFLKNVTLLIGHDIKPLLRMMHEAGVAMPPRWFDTRIAAYLLYPDLRDYDLGKLYFQELGSPLSEDPRERPGAIWKLRNVLWDKIKSANLTSVFEDIEMPLIPVLASMEAHGIKVDERHLEKLLNTAQIELARLEKGIYQHAGEEFNINSPQQLGVILFQKLALKGRVRKTGGGAPSTAAPELEKLRDSHPIIDLILEYRELQKLKTTYIEPFPALIQKDKRIHTTYNQAGAGTGRLSSIDPNLQNIPTRTEIGQEFRRAFIAEKGYQLVAFDYSQLELRLAAHIAHDEKMTEAFQNGEDIHTRTAAEIFKVAPSDVTKDMRRQAKVLNFGIMYGMGSLGFARAAQVSRDQAKQFIEQYFQEFKGIAAYMEKTKQEAYKNGYVETLFGRRRPMPDIRSTMPQLRAQAERMAINHPIQGTEADLIKMAMIQVDAFVQKKKLDDTVRMLLQVHDELVFEVRQDSLDVLPKLRDIMEQVAKLDVPLTVDVKQGKNWADMEKVI